MELNQDPNDQVLETDNKDQVSNSDIDLFVDPELLKIDKARREKCHYEVRTNQQAANRRAYGGYSKQKTIAVFEKRDRVSIAVDKLDRMSTEDKRVFGIVIDIPKQDRYQIQTPHGILKNPFPTNQLLKLPDSIAVDIPPNATNEISLRHAHDMEALADAAQIHCNCKKGCNSRRCKCIKHDQRCSVSCHDEDHDCGNLSLLPARTQKGHRPIEKRQRANTVGESITVMPRVS